MYLIIVWSLLYSIFTSLSIMLLGDRKLISGNLFNLSNVFNLVVNWKFILSMLLAILSRITFIAINNKLLQIPSLAQNATTITSFITTFAFIFIILANFVFLNEKLNLQQGCGAFLIMAGIFVMLK